jgi:hypothetical protein
MAETMRLAHQQLADIEAEMEELGIKPDHPLKTQLLRRFGD